MVTKQSIQYSPLINFRVRCVLQNAIVEGIVVFESQQILEVQVLSEDKDTNLIKKILKSSIQKFEVFDNNKNQFIEVDSTLIKGDLTYRLKKMK